MAARYLLILWHALFWLSSEAVGIKSHVRKAISSDSKCGLVVDKMFTKAIVASTVALALCGWVDVAPAGATLYDIDLGGAEISLTGQPNAWEKQRQKRTTAIKLMEKKGMIKVATDDNGTQYLKLPWIPNRNIPYKSLSVSQRLFNEVCAGAFGEIFKDGLLHALDTLKTRRQSSVQNKNIASDNDDSNNDNSVKNNNGIEVMATIASSSGTSSGSMNSGSEVASASVDSEQRGSNVLIAKALDLYRGFPVVLAASLPQGGAFFLVKKGSMEIIGNAAPAVTGDPLGLVTSFLANAVPISLGVMVYWLFRTPAEVIKTQVQTGQSSSVLEAITGAKAQPAGLAGLWKFYPVMLTLDIPFQIINFILYGFVSEAVANAGIDQSLWTRLFCGISCGMISAAVTCPVDVCKTRIIRKDKQNQAILAAAAANGTAVSSTFDDNKNVFEEMQKIVKEEGVGALLLGLQQRLLYTGLANGIRLSAYGTSRMDLMMRSLDDL